MQWLVEVGLSNALAASVLALAAWIVGKFWRRPAVTHALWLLVLLKLLTPPIIEFPLPWTIPRTVAFDAEVPVRQEFRAPLPLPHRQEPAPPAPHSSAHDLIPPVQLTNRNSRSHSGQPGPPTYDADRPTAGFNSQTTTDSDAPAIELSQQPGLIPEPIPAIDASTTSPWLGWGQLAAIVSFVGLLAWVALQAVLGLRLRSMLRASAPASLELSKTAAEIARRMGLRRWPQVRIVAGTGSPMLCGLGKRTSILMPAVLLPRLGPEAQATVLAHELAHYWRGDQWARLVEVVVTGLYWWHPVVWWARQQLEIAEEQCCDAHVLELCAGKTRVYAEALLDIVDLINEPPRQIRPAMTSGIGHRPSLQKRLLDLMKRRYVPTMTPLTRRAIVAIGAVCLFYHPTLFITEAPKLQAASANIPVPLLAASSARNGNKANQPRVLEELLSSKGLPSPELPPPQPAEAAHEKWATAISPNGRYHLTVSRGYQCQLREVTAGRVHRLSDHRITCVAFTLDSERFVTGDLQGTVRLWDAVSGEALQTLTEQAGPIRSVCLAPAGDRLAVAGQDGVVELVSLSAASDRHVLARLDAPIRCARFSPDGSRLAVVTDTWKTNEAGTVAVYDVVSGRPLLRWEVKGPTGAIAFPSDKRLITVEWSGRVREWSLPALDAVDLPPIAKDVVSAASFSADTRVLEDLAHHTTDRF